MYGTPFQQEVLLRLDSLAPVYIVGGAVRDRLLGSSSGDIDAVIALPAESVQTKLKEWGYVPHLLGQGKPTVTVFQGPERLDIIEFGGNLREDALRRDFTLDAIYVRVGTEELFDPLNGVSDLYARQLQACGKAEERFAEDPIRLLRMVRFIVKYGLQVEERTWQAAQETLPLLASSAKERVTEELSRILVLAEVETALVLLDDLGYWQAYLPELARLKGLVQNRYHTLDAWEHTVQVVKNTPPRLLLRLAALWHDLGKWDTASRECRVWGKLQWVDKEWRLEGYELMGKGLERWRGKSAEILGGRLDNHPERIQVKRVGPGEPGSSGFAWVPEGKRHFLGHERESGKVVKQVLHRYVWSMFLNQSGRRGEQELVFLIENHMAGTLAFMAELRGDKSLRSLEYKAKRFAWQYGWNGRRFDPERVEDLLALWQADFFGGKQRAEEDGARFAQISERVQKAAGELAEGMGKIRWEPFVEFADRKLLEGAEVGHFKEFIRPQVVLAERALLEDGQWLEREWKKYKRERGRNLQI